MCSCSIELGRGGVPAKFIRDTTQEERQKIQTNSADAYTFAAQYETAQQDTYSNILLEDIRRENNRGRSADVSNY